MNIVIAILVAFAYLAFGFGFALFLKEEDSFVMIEVLCWPVVIVAIVLIVVILSLNKICLVIYRKLRGCFSEQEDM